MLQDKLLIESLSYFRRLEPRRSKAKLSATHCLKTGSCQKTKVQNRLKSLTISGNVVKSLSFPARSIYRTMKGGLSFKP